MRKKLVAGLVGFVVVACGGYLAVSAYRGTSATMLPETSVLNPGDTAVIAGDKDVWMDDEKRAVPAPKNVRVFLERGTQCVVHEDTLLSPRGGDDVVTLESFSVLKVISDPGVYRESDAAFEERIDDAKTEAEKKAIRKAGRLILKAPDPGSELRIVRVKVTEGEREGMEGAVLRKDILEVTH